MSEPVVSICSITYNHAPYIRQCLDGFLMQKTNFPFEIIINDDCSTDGTTEIIKEYAEKYPDLIKPIFHEENQYKKGVRGMFVKYVFPKAQGKYLALCEGDDYWIDPLKLQKQVDILESDDSVSMVYTSFKTVDSKGNLMLRPDYENYKKRSFTGDVFYKLITSGNFIMTLTTCFRKEVYENDVIKGYPVMLDYALFLGVSSTGKAVFLPEETGCYRYVENSAMNSNIHSIQKNYLQVKKHFVCALINGEIIKVQGYSLIRKMKMYSLLMKQALVLYKKKIDKEFITILLKKKVLITIIPISLLLIIKDKIINHIS